MFRNEVSPVSCSLTFFSPSNKKAKLIALNKKFHDENMKYYLKTDIEREQYAAHFNNGKLYNSNNKLLVNKKLLYVLSEDNTLYVISKNSQFHHSYFVAGQPVRAAGIIETNFIGEISMISNESGHYIPKTSDMISALTFLLEHMEESEGFDSIEYEAHDNVPIDGRVYVFLLSDILCIEITSTIADFKEMANRTYSGRKSAQISKHVNSHHNNCEGYDNTMDNAYENLGIQASSMSRYGLQLKNF